VIYQGHKPGKRIIFDGNSLTNQGASGLVGGQRYPLTCYSQIVALGNPITYFNFGIGSRRTAALTAEFNTKVLPTCRPGDWVVFWEITNSAHDYTSDTEGTALFADQVAYCTLVKSYGINVACLTGIARDMTGFDDANITSRILACNALMRASPSFCDLLIDVGMLPQFDTKADTTNLTYYNSDQTHLTNAGYDLIADKVYTDISPYLS